MTDNRLPKTLPHEVPNYHEREAAHLRALAATATTQAVKERLLREAEGHETLAKQIAEAPET